MKQLKRALAILLAVVMIVAVFPASVLAADDEAETFPYDGQGQAIIAWKMLSTATGYRISIYQDTVSDATLIETQNFGRTETEWDATDIIKTYGPGMYVAKLEALRNGTVRKTIVSDLMVIQMDQADANLAVVIDDEAATVSWDPIEEATLGCKITVALTDKESGEEVATQDYEVAAGETSVDVTDFVVEYADNETALELSATLSVIGDLTIQEKELVGPNGQTKLYKVCYLNSEPSAPAVAEQLVGILPLGVITSTEVDAVPGDPGKLTVNYKLEGGAVDYTYVKQLKLVLSCTDGEDVTTKTFTVDEVAAEGTIDVSKLIGNPGDYDWTVTLSPKYIGNAQTVNEGETKVNYTVYKLPAPVLTVADDASTISWPAVVASDEVENPTTFTDENRYKIEVSTDGENWSELSGGAITPVKDEEDNVTGFVVDISDKIAEGDTKNFKVTLLNTKENSTYDPRFEGESYAQVEVYKTYQPTNVAFDVETGAYANPPEEEDQVFLIWNEPTSSDGIESFKITIYEAATEAEVDEEGNPVTDEEGNPVMNTTKTPIEFTVAASDVVYDAGVARIDVSEYIDAVNVADYTATVQSIGKHENDDYSHFDADSGITAECEKVTSGAVATAMEAAKIEQQTIDGNDVLVLVVTLDDANDNFAKIESAWLSNFNNGKTSYMEPIEGDIDETAKTVTFDLSTYYYDDADTSGAIQRLPSGDWSGTVSVYSLNNALNADTSATVKASYKPYQLQILGEELVDEEGNPTGEVGEPLVVDLETGEVSWADAYAYDDENNKIEESKADYYMVKLEYLDGSEWKGVKIVDGDDTNEWEKIDDTEEVRNVYNIHDSEAADGGMLPGRVYRVNVKAYSNKPLEYIESSPEETVKLCKIPAVTAAITDADYTAGELSWTGAEGFTYPTGVTYQIDAVDGETTYTDTDDASTYELYKLPVDDEGNTDYGTYTTTVTALGIVADGVNYIQSDASNEVTAYRGVVPAEDIDDAAFAYEAGENGGKLVLSFTLPVEDDYTEDYDKAMAAAIDPDYITVKIYSDTGNLLGEYAYDKETGKADVTQANDLTSGTNWMESIDPGTNLYVAICVGSLTEYVDGYSDFNALEDLTGDQLKTYLATDEMGDAVKVAPLSIPAREVLGVTAVIATSADAENSIPAGAVVIDTTELQEDATDVTYKVDIAIKNGNTTSTTTIDNVDPANPIDTSDIITAGVEATVTVTATDNTGKYAPAVIEMKAYKLKNPVINSISEKTGKVVKVVDDTTYAYTNTFTFENADDATATETAQYNDPNVEFDLEVEAHNVNTILTSSGGFDEANEIYVIDADNPATATTFAGLLYNFELVDGKIKTDTDGKLYVEIQADTSHGFWSADNDYNYMWWEGSPDDLKSELYSEEYGTVTMEPTKKANVDFATGIVKLYLKATPTAGAEYTLKLTTSAKAKYKAVAGGYEAELNTVSFNVNYLEVKDLKYDYETGKVTWTADPNATSYTVELMRDDGELGWRAAKTPADTTTDAKYDFEYEAGKLYKVTVTATSTDPNYEDSRPEVDNSIIYVYKLTDPSGASISDQTGALTFTADPNAVENAVALTIDDVETDKATYTQDADSATSGIIDFTLQKAEDPADVTATITSKGGETKTVVDTDSNECTAYIIDAANTTSATTKSGELFHFTLVDGKVLQDSKGYYVELKADTTHDFWSDTNDDNYMWWQGAPNDLKGVFSNTNGTINNKPVKRADVDFATGIVKLYFATKPAEGEYKLTLTTNPKLKFEAVAGGYTEDLEPVTYGVQYLEVKDLKYDYEEGKVTWTADPNAESYTVELMRNDGEEGWKAVKTPADTTTSAEYDFEYVAGKEYKLTVTATTSNANFEDSRPAVDGSSIVIYKLLPATTVSVSDRDGLLTVVEPENKYAHSKEVTVTPDSAEGDTIPAGAYDETTNTVTFTKVGVPADVTTSVALTGSKIEGASEDGLDVYVIDSVAVSTTNKVGELFHFTLANDGKIMEDTKGYYVELQADIGHDFWDDVNDTNYMWWQGAPNDLKGVFTGDSGTINNQPVKRANVDFATGIVKLYLKSAPVDSEYTLKLTTNPKAKYAAVAGGYEETLKPVTYGGVQYLKVEGIAYNYDQEAVTWTADQNAEKYIVELQKKLDDKWTGIADPIEVTEPSFTIPSDLGYEPGVEYKVIVTATTSDVSFEDSRPEEDGSMIIIFKLPKAEDVAVSDRDGKLTYTAPTTDYAYVVDVLPSESYNAETKTVTFDTSSKTPVEVTTTVKFRGSMIEGAGDGGLDVYLLDSEEASTTNTVGELFHFSLVDNQIKKTADGIYYVEIQADTGHYFWSSNNNKNYLWWTDGENELKASLESDEYGSRPFKSVKRTSDVDFETGIVKLYLTGTAAPEDGAEYKVKLTTNPKAKYAAVAGGYTETLEGTVNTDAILVADILANAKAYQYDPEYVYNGTITPNGTTVAYEANYVDVVDHSVSPMKITADLARFLGAIYRGNATDAITSFTYKGDEYTWDAEHGLLGSNWVNGTTTLVSVIAADLQADLDSSGKATFTVVINGVDVVTEIKLAMG
ncbi:MAG: hypothetical protein IKR93_03640 [Firmicutes bacterium]|nr:hypothetical protein [Bacillota bacterium]